MVSVLNIDSEMFPPAILWFPFLILIDWFVENEIFLTLKVGDDPSSQAPFVSWLPVRPSAPEVAVLRKANLIFQ